VLILAGGIVEVALESVIAFGLPLPSLEAVNESGETVWITLLRRTNTAGNREIPGQFVLTVPVIPAIRQGGFRLAPGASLHIRYDWGHVNLSEIVVRDAAGDHRMLPIDRELTEMQIILGLSERFVIPPLGELSAAPDYVVAAAEEGNFNTRGWGLFSLGFIPVIFLILYFRVRLPRRAQRPAMADTTPVPGT
jgi:hypothetical protein